MPAMTTLPRIIQGGMGVGISDWRLANAVSRAGGLGVVSGTALDQVMARRLQMGDPGGHIRRALSHFPVPALAQSVLDTYLIDGGKATDASFAMPAMLTHEPTDEWLALCVVANFVEVWLAREGHDGPVGVNFLEKIQLPHLPSIYGAMLAGVDVVIMGAGIPLKVPGVLDAFVTHTPSTYPLVVTGAESPVLLHFDPTRIVGAGLPPLCRPQFLAIVASDVLALTMQRRANGRVDGFIVEGPTAGGHNAPPRGAAQFNDRGEPIYGPRDEVNLDKLKALGLPFWLAGGRGDAAQVAEAIAAGAHGVQVGTAFAICAESGLRDDLRQVVINRIQSGEVDVFTDPKASPTGFPFKVAAVPGTLSEAAVRDARPRICDLGYLREAYMQADDTVAYRCPAEPVNVYASKGGDPADTEGRACICNALISTVGLPQVRARRLVEPPIVTSGNDLAGMGRFIPADGTAPHAADIVAALSAGIA